MADPETDKDPQSAVVPDAVPTDHVPAAPGDEARDPGAESGSDVPSPSQTADTPAADLVAVLAASDDSEDSEHPGDSEDSSGAADERPVEAGPDAALVELQPAVAPGAADDPEAPRELDGEDAGASGADADGTVDGLDPGDIGMEPLEDDALTKTSAELKAIVEALIFASPEPLTPKALFKLLDSEPKEDVLAALEALKLDYDRPGGLQLVEVAGGFQIVTRPDLHEWVRRLFHERSTQKLSVQALETLAVIAYRQPITALEITEVRGVSASGVLNTLLERHLIKIVGRKQVVGRPFMYATTKEFLIRFGLKDLSDLPRVEDMAESLGIESSLLVEQVPTEEQLPLSEPDLERGSAGLEEEPRDDAPEPGFRDDETPSDDDEPGPSIH